MWAADGSLAVDAVAQGWTRGRLSALRRVAGPWAVAVWDPDSHETLLVADPMGLLPLFWASTAEGILVADSWLARLVDRHDVDEALDYEGILLDQGGGFLRGPSVAHRTGFVAVSRVPGGRALRIRPDGSTRLETYWNPRDLPGPDESLTLTDCAELLRERVDAGVRRLTPYDVPVGSHVSGGLDCTTVACVANRVLGEAGSGLVAGYSWAPGVDVVPRFPGDERGLLADVQREQGFPVHTVDSEADGEWFWNLDPVRYPDANHARECLVLSQARAGGVRVLLSGWGGDELASFNGRGVMPSLMHRGNLGTAWREFSHLAAVSSSRPLSLPHRLRRFASVSMSTSPRLRALLRSRGQSGRVAKADEVAEALRAFSPLAADLQADTARAFANVRDHREHQLLLLELGHLQRRIAWWYQTGLLMGVDYRYPLLDLGVVAAALRLPWWAYLSRGWTRTAFRLAVEPWVPASVAWNVQKYEPALFWAPGAPSSARPVLERRRSRPGDARFDETMRLAALGRDTGQQPVSSASRVTSRSDLAARP